MIVALFTTISLALGQLTSSSDGMVHYVFELDNEIVYGLAKPGDVGKPRFEIRVEEPWNRSVKTRKMRGSSITFMEKEPLANYKQRMKQSWRSHDGDEKSTSRGPIWVVKSEYELAARAQKLLEPKTISVDLQSVPEINALTAPPIRAEIGFVRQWWLHTLICLTALVLGSATAWWGFLRTRWSGIG